MAACQASFLSEIPVERLRPLLERGVRVEVPAGSIVYEQDAPPSQTGLVLGGLFRAYLSSPSGRQVTVRYMRAGCWLSAVVERPVQVSVQALSAGSLWLIPSEVTRAWALGDAQVAWLCAEQVALGVASARADLALSAFGTLKQRIVRHLLELAVNLPRDGECLCAPISQQQLADAVGSVREVVARVLRELRDAGIVRGGARGIAILDPIRLHDEGWPDEDQGPVAGA